MESSVSRIGAPAEERDARLIRSRDLWLWLLAIGAALWVVAGVITGVTRDEVLLWVQTLAYNGLLLLNAAIGTFWLIRLWRRSAPTEAAAEAPV